MIDVSFNLEGVELVQRRLSGLEMRARDPISPVADDLDRVFAQIVAKQFETEGASGAFGKWRELSATTRVERASKGFGPDHPILERTGTLKRSLTLASAPGALRVVAPLYYARGSVVPYFKYHQSNKPRTAYSKEGVKYKVDTDSSEAFLPHRPMVSLTKQDIHNMFRPISVYLTGKAPTIGLRDRGRPSTEG